MSTFERQYLTILQDILDNGEFTPANRADDDTYATWGQMLKFDLVEGFPMVTTRKTAFRVAFEEVMFFLRGQFDTNILVDKKINIWKGNTTREFLDNAGLGYLPEGHMGKGYGVQWRNFGGEYMERTNYTKIHKGVDQLVELLNGMKKNPFSRRHIITGWNPAQLKEMALPPCHLYQQYQVTPSGKLNSSFVMRSWDFLYGGPFNIMGYAFLNHIFAKYMHLEPGVMLGIGHDVHLYSKQLPMAREQVTREPFPLPKIEILKELKTLEDILSLEYSDILITGYESHPDFKDKPPMAV